MHCNFDFTSKIFFCIAWQNWRGKRQISSDCQISGKHFQEINFGRFWSFKKDFLTSMGMWDMFNVLLKRPNDGLGK